MNHRIVPPVALTALALGAIVLAAEVKSGLQVGDPAGAYNVKDCTGPNEGKSLCYR